MELKSQKINQEAKLKLNKNKLTNKKNNPKLKMNNQPKSHKNDQFFLKSVIASIKFGKSSL